MKLDFLNRATELKALKKIYSLADPSIFLLYGRRRCGKSRLLQQLDNAVYYLADQSDQSLQRQALARALAKVLPGFDAATYHSWHALFEALNKRNPQRNKIPLPIILDEFPYLVAESPELPSIIQKFIDTGELKVHLILSGSSQRMMNGLALDDTSPLYGRAREVLKIRPLKAGWIIDALKLKSADAIASYALWGGIPRYWELAGEYRRQEDAIRDLVLNRDGILHNEPRRLLLDDLRSDTQPHSLLAVIGSGVHRMSEIAARLEKPAMNLMRPLEILTELGLVKREIPFGETEKNTKRTLYSISDPFLRFWYRLVYPNLSNLELELYDQVITAWTAMRDQHVGSVWEDLARESVPHVPIGNKKWGEARRWWGKLDGRGPAEIDIVARSVDGSSILLGEAKWGEIDTAYEMRKLEDISASLPFTKGRSVTVAFWTGRIGKKDRTSLCVAPDQVLQVLR
jgi:hypothetical protein